MQTCAVSIVGFLLIPWDDCKSRFTVPTGQLGGGGLRTWTAYWEKPRAKMGHEGENTPLSASESTLLQYAMKRATEQSASGFFSACWHSDLDRDDQQGDERIPQPPDCHGIAASDATTYIQLKSRPGSPRKLTQQKT